MTVVVVTDSTSALPEPLRTARGGLTVLGIPVLIDGVEYREGEDIGGEVIVRAIREGREVTTSGLPPEELRATYTRLLDEGASGIVSVHLSGRLSGTVAAAEAAAAGFGGRVAVVDSLGAGMGVGYPALAALDAAEQGAELLIAAAAAQTAIGRTSTYFYLDTLEYLRRGGRISAARAIVGTALSVKPILGVEDGRIDVVEKVRTPTRGLQRLAALAVADAGEAEVEMTVHHLAAERRAEALAGWLGERFEGRLRRIDVTEVGAAVGAHCGPGLVGVITRRLP
ncbi:DegV family protein [Glycomyces algeriensis]|uniref:DegV domain-containing protein n=1 Tax=Glycomyces algeriensis TaxID=256037 RepID=A0A9W6GED5_9ACTN|nr:DegV family protein [Glycomyces algeriensis]MDA1369040.1 DegV family protein [Glycomyces algeriensis]MDR7352464.1 DegV family protein with EDD domain [Glycomyces algeriensis]GLI45204.1 DegV domain-containing protein [Glycomyces algeriensis]